MSESKRPRLTEPALRILAVMLSDPTEPWYGLDLIDRCGVKSGTLYPLLARLAQAGWLVAQREDVEPAKAGRPARTYYLLTGVGETETRTALAGVHVPPNVTWALS